MLVSPLYTLKEYLTTPQGRI